MSYQTWHFKEVWLQDYLKQLTIFYLWKLYNSPETGCVAVNTTCKWCGRPTRAMPDVDTCTISCGVDQTLFKNNNYSSGYILTIIPQGKRAQVVAATRCDNAEFITITPWGLNLTLGLPWPRMEAQERSLCTKVGSVKGIKERLVKLQQTS